MRLIDADEVLKTICDTKLVKWQKGIIWALVDMHKTVDAVPVIRCKNCKHWQCDDSESYCDELGIFNTDMNSYCSYAKRKEEWLQVGCKFKGETMGHTIETPVYINTRFNYFCDGCEESELTLENNKFYANDAMYNNYYVLTCENYETCKRLMHRLRSMKGKDNGETVREVTGSDLVCGLCEYDAGTVGEEPMECPGFDSNECFKLKESLRKYYETFDEVTRCKDCRYYDEKAKTMDTLCTRKEGCRETIPEGFCGWAIPKKGAE